MALSLTAEQREVRKIFNVDEQYVVPSYQRPYSWGYDECFQFYTDLIEKYEDKEDYFIGNVIIAKSESDKEHLQVIDGQQRMTTLLIMIKVLYLFNPRIKILGKILELEDWKGESKVPRLVTNVFEEDDQTAFDRILGYDYEDFDERLVKCSNSKGKISPRKCYDKFEYNSLHFFSWFKFYSERNNDLESFVSYLLKSVYLLPIELTGKTIDEASEKALVIFETINNRGLNLSDADIFKAKLYQKAKNVKQEGHFIKQWVEFKNSCDSLNINIVEVFRYYSHIIRGGQGITSSEINLREFFVRQSYSPFNNLKYETILEHLFKIIEVLDFLESERTSNSILSPYLYLIDIYTNQYPKYALFTYFYYNGTNVDNKLIDFCESIVRYFYLQGSTTAVKFETFNIIKNVFLGLPISSYCKHITSEQLSSLGLLSKGYALLSHYIEVSSTLTTFSVDKIVNTRDFAYLKMIGYDENDISKFNNLLGNYIVIDLKKKYMPLGSKFEYYQKSNIDSVRQITQDSFSLSLINERDRRMKSNIMKFFSCDDSINSTQVF